MNKYENHFQNPQTKRQKPWKKMGQKMLLDFISDNI